MSGPARDWARDDLEWELRMEQILADTGLKKRQAEFELPKFVVALVVAVAAVMGAAGALFGYSIGHH